MDALFNMQKIRFSVLDALFNKYNENIYSDTRVHVFINLESILRKIVTGNIDDYFKVKNKEKDYELISNIFNIAAHYRLYFNKLRLESKVYLYLGHPFDSEFRNEEFIPNYRGVYKHKFTKDAKGKYVGNSINNIIDPLKTILQYIEGVYLITSDYTEPSLIPKIISEDFGEKDYGLVITTDRYDYQYVNHRMDVIRNKREQSYYVNKNNVIDVIKRESKVLSDIRVPPLYLPFILSFMEDKSRNIPNIKGVGIVTLLKSIENGIKNNILSKDKFSFSMMEPLLKEDMNADIRSNFICIDLDSQYELCTDSSIIPIKEQLVDLFDEQAIKKINDTYFINNPMMIMEIQPFIRRKQNRNIFGQ